MDREDGEMSDDNAMVVDDVKEPISYTDDCTLVYKADKAGLIVEKLEKVDASKIEERAKRFGLNLTGNRVITQRQIDELYSNFGIESGNERHFRFDAINLHGVDGLSTKEIFQYLEDYKPVSLEWIDEVSCNIVCQDHISAALALLVHSREIKDPNLKEMLAANPNHHWREGMPHPKKDLILMRFATNGDKKMNKKKAHSKTTDEYGDQNMDAVSKNPWGDLCKSWGVYDHQEVFQRKPRYNNDEDDDVEEPDKIVKIKNKSLASRLGKRPATRDNYSNEEAEASDSDSEWKTKSKAPRMRMHADDEESKRKRKQASQLSKDSDGYSALSIEVENSHSNYKPRDHTIISDKFRRNTVYRKKHGIQSRLGDKVITVEDNESFSSDEVSDNSDSYVMSRVHKVNSSNNSVWSRLDRKPTGTRNTSDHNDLRQILKSKKHGKSDDLRDKLGKSKQSNLRIEIDNNYAHDDDDDL
ncbi:nuclear cap-binding protein subunit 3 [Spodoptera frugiperda]|uniref:Nuclear cap-binding protein subunit 3 n=1 Tax=Spodoptera frugiperda TaxID=7108 RepID=A0A9R0D0F9_SPOFR|nr:nuclear cap-binding protein subunit 3 [Spodoptera frugiperda]